METWRIGSPRFVLSVVSPTKRSSANETVRPTLRWSDRNESGDPIDEPAQRPAICPVLEEAQSADLKCV
jgi:hypothetical protein